MFFNSLKQKFQVRGFFLKMCKFCAPPNKSNTLRHWLQTLKILEVTLLKASKYQNKIVQALQTMSIYKRAVKIIIKLC